MDSTYQFKLIDGEFSAKEAQYVLLSVINSKVEFHSRELFSDGVTNNLRKNNSTKRIADLTKWSEKIKQVTDEADAGARFEISGIVTIQLKHHG